MAESERLINTVANHHEDDHGATAHDLHAEESDTHLLESTHEEDEHVERHEDSIR